MKCPYCNSELTSFNSNTGIYLCPSCDKEIDVDDLIDLDICYNCGYPNADCTCEVVI